jgi:hypothetical protein
LHLAVYLGGLHCTTALRFLVRRVHLLHNTVLTETETPRYTFDVLYDVEKATVDARKYRYGKQGNILNPVTQAQTRREMNGYKKPPVTLAEVFRFYVQKKQAIRLFGCAMSWLYVTSIAPSLLAHR